MDIVKIIEGCKKKETKCQKILYGQFYGYALKIAFRYVYRYDSAKEVTNEGFVKVFRQIEKFRYKGEPFPERLLTAWIKRIIINTSIDELRRNKMTPEIVDIPEDVWEETDDSLNADHAVLSRELITYVKNLPPVYRIVFNMFVIDGFTHFHIASTLGISIAASESNLFNARIILQRIIDEKEGMKSRRS